MPDCTIKASELKVGDIIIDRHLWRVDSVAINPLDMRANADPDKFGVPVDMLVDVDATSLDCEVEARRFASYRPDKDITVRRDNC